MSIAVFYCHNKPLTTVAETFNANGKRGRSPSKPPSVLGKKSKFSSGTATPTPSIGRPALPPSKLGRPPKNRSPAQPPSPISVSSPDYSIVSSQDTGGMIGRKTLPTSMYDQPIIVDDQDAPGESTRKLWWLMSRRGICAR